MVTDHPFTGQYIIPGGRTFIEIITAGITTVCQYRNTIRCSLSATMYGGSILHGTIPVIVNIQSRTEFQVERQSKLCIYLGRQDMPHIVIETVIVRIIPIITRVIQDMGTKEVIGIFTVTVHPFPCFFRNYPTGIIFIT